MARVPYVDRDALAEAERDLPIGDSNITRALSNSPPVARMSGDVARFTKEMGLDPRLRELAIIQVGYSLHCAYEYAHHIRVGLAAGVSEEDIDALAEETAGRPSRLEPLARAVLRGAREMADGRAMSGKTFAELQAALGDRHLVELVFAVANYTAVSRMLLTLEVEVEDEYHEDLKRFPLPE